MTSQLLVLLPPSETKSDGGNRCFPKQLRWPQLDAVRAEVLDDLIALSFGEPQTAARALKISAKLADVELERNRALTDPLRKPAIERYTGVLYDAIDVATLQPDARAWANTHVAIHSALYGLVGAADAIGAYRFSHNSTLPAKPIKRRWREAITCVLQEHNGPILDLRSKGYVELGPVLARDNYAWLDVRERLADGSTRSLNHFNKRTKGLLVRFLAQELATAPEPATIERVYEVLGAFGEVVVGEGSTTQFIRLVELGTSYD